MTNDERERDNDDIKVERDHPQTRKGEEDARGSAEWNEDVVKPERERGSHTAHELADEAEETRRDAVGEDKASHAFGSGDKASDE